MYHHANVLVGQLRTDLNNQGNNMLAMVRELIPHDDPDQVNEFMPPESAANTTV